MDQDTSGVMQDAACARQVSLVKIVFLFLKKDDIKQIKNTICASTFVEDALQDTALFLPRRYTPGIIRLASFSRR